ncbi:MAG: DUF4412 domain-containing protein [Vicinamibacterales bacterium]
MNATASALSVLAALVFSSQTVLAADGILLSERTTTGNRTVTNEIKIEPTRIRAQVAPDAGEAQTIIFDGTRQVMWMISDQRKGYSEMTKADVDRMAGQMNEALSRMREQMANLPPAQRAQLEAMMRGRGMPGAGAQAAAQTEYRRAGTATVGSWTCTRYEGFVNGQKQSEVCTVDPATLGFRASDFEVSKQLAEFFRQMLPEGSDAMFRIGDGGGQGFDGLPVRRVYTRGNQQIVSEVTAITRGTFPDSDFQVPAGYTKLPLPGTGRGR